MGSVVESILSLGGQEMKIPSVWQTEVDTWHPREATKKKLNHFVELHRTVVQGNYEDSIMFLSTLDRIIHNSRLVLKSTNCKDTLSRYHSTYDVDMTATCRLCTIDNQKVYKSYKGLFHHLKATHFTPLAEIKVCENQEAYERIKSILKNIEVDKAFNNVVKEIQQPSQPLIQIPAPIIDQDVSEQELLASTTHLVDYMNKSNVVENNIEIDNGTTTAFLDSVINEFIATEPEYSVNPMVENTYQPYVESLQFNNMVNEGSDNHSQIIKPTHIYGDEHNSHEEDHGSFHTTTHVSNVEMSDAEISDVDVTDTPPSDGSDVDVSDVDIPNPPISEVVTPNLPAYDMTTFSFDIGAFEVVNSDTSSPKTPTSEVAVDHSNRLENTPVQEVLPTINAQAICHSPLPRNSKLISMNAKPTTQVSDYVTTEDETPTTSIEQPKPRKIVGLKRLRQPPTDSEDESDSSEEDQPSPPPVKKIKKVAKKSSPKATKGKKTTKNEYQSSQNKKDSAEMKKKAISENNLLHNQMSEELNKQLYSEYDEKRCNEKIAKLNNIVNKVSKNNMTTYVKTVKSKLKSYAKKYSLKDPNNLNVVGPLTGVVINNDFYAKKPNHTIRNYSEIINIYKMYYDKDVTSQERKDRLQTLFTDPLIKPWLSTMKSANKKYPTNAKCKKGIETLQASRCGIDSIDEVINTLPFEENTLVIAVNNVNWKVAELKLRHGKVCEALDILKVDHNISEKDEDELKLKINTESSQKKNISIPPKMKHFLDRMSSVFKDSSNPFNQYTRMSLTTLKKSIFHPLLNEMSYEHSAGLTFTNDFFQNFMIVIMKTLYQLAENINVVSKMNKRASGSDIHDFGLLALLDGQLPNDDNKINTEIYNKFPSEDRIYKVLTQMQTMRLPNPPKDMSELALRLNSGDMNVIDLIHQKCSANVMKCVRIVLFKFVQQVVSNIVRNVSLGGPIMEAGEISWTVFKNLIYDGIGYDHLNIIHKIITNLTPICINTGEYLESYWSVLPTEKKSLMFNELLVRKKMMNDDEDSDMASVSASE